MVLLKFWLGSMEVGPNGLLVFLKFDFDGVYGCEMGL
jgi:hypothetical protein